MHVAQNLSEMWLSTFEIGVGQLCAMRNRDEITVLMREEKPYPVWVWCRRKSHLVECEQSPKRNENGARLRALDLVLISSSLSEHYMDLYHGIPVSNCFPLLLT